MRKYWTEQEKNILRQMWSSKQYDYGRIGRVLLRTPEAVETMRCRLKLPSPPTLNWPNKDKDALKQWWNDGLSMEEIAFRLKRPVSGVRAMRRTLKLSLRRVPNGEGEHRKPLRAFVNKKQETFAIKQAHKMGITVAAYLRTLIERDMRRDAEYVGRIHHATNGRKQSEGIHGAI